MALALVVIEEHARRAVHLRDDDALGAVDDEGAVRRHERHVAHIDVLLLDVLDRLRGGVGIDVEHDEAQRHLERRGEGHAALAAFVDVIFRRLEFVFDEFEQRGVGEIRNRKHRLEDGLQALVGTAALGLVDQQKLIVGGLLDFDQIGHFRDFADVAEKFANTLAAGERLRRMMSHVAPRTFAKRRSSPRDAKGSSPHPRPALEAGAAGLVRCQARGECAANRIGRKVRTYLAATDRRPPVARAPPICKAQIATAIKFT